MSGIDAVITWVDGRDPAHQQRLAAFLAERGGARPVAAHATRFDSAEEIDYCVASILRYAPWFRRIHIVTDRQVPALVQRLAGTPWAQRVRVVDHRELFGGFERFLPTFNSRAIISVLWRIPELAERFVYFNDDFMLLRAVEEGDFFRGDAIVVRGRWRLQSLSGWKRLLVRRSAGGDDDAASARDAQETAARMVGYRLRYFRLYHYPYSFLRSPLERYFAAHPDRLEANVRHRLRSSRQFKTEGLAAHLALAERTAVPDNSLRVTQLDPAARGIDDLRERMRHADTHRQQAVACVQSLDMATEDVRGELLAWLDRRVGRIQTALDA